MILDQTTPCKAAVQIWDNWSTAVPNRPMLASGALLFFDKHKLCFLIEWHMPKNESGQRRPSRPNSKTALQ